MLFWDAETVEVDAAQVLAREPKKRRVRLLDEVLVAVRTAEGDVEAAWNKE